MRRVKCKGSSCSADVVWVVDELGRKIPCDPKPPVYEVLGTDPDGTVRVRRAQKAMVSHFATCPDASSFSRSKR